MIGLKTLVDFNVFGWSRSGEFLVKLKMHFLQKTQLFFQVRYFYKSRQKWLKKDEIFFIPVTFKSLFAVHFVNIKYFRHIFDSVNNSFVFMM